MCITSRPAWPCRCHPVQFTACPSSVDDWLTRSAQVWWRAQAAAYIIRPNNHTMAKIWRLRQNPALHHVWQNGRPATHLSVPYPLPAGTISMHVRCELECSC